MTLRFIVGRILREPPELPERNDDAPGQRPWISLVLILEQRPSILSPNCNIL